MKKLGIGCAILAGILVLAIGLGSCFLIHKARSFVSGYSKLAEIPALNAGIRNQAAFAPPGDGRLAAAQVERYMAVQRGIQTRLGERFRQLKEKYDQLSRDLEQKGREAGIGESLAALNDLVGILLDAKRAQVDALNEAGLSLGEYQWIRQQTLAALGYGFASFNLEALAAGDPSKLTEVLAAAAGTAGTDAVLTQNRVLLAPYEDSKEQWLPLSFFGL